jgi:hypothetical protein
MRTLALSGELSIIERNIFTPPIVRDREVGATGTWTAQDGSPGRQSQHDQQLPQDQEPDQLRFCLHPSRDAVGCDVHGALLVTEASEPFQPEKHHFARRPRRIS